MELTLEQKQQIIKEYNDRSNRAKDIRDKWHISSRQMSSLIQEMGAEFRCPNAHKPRNSIQGQIKVCRSCRKKIDVKGARFCPFCGGDVRDDKDIALERLKALFGILENLPYGIRDKAQEDIKTVISLVEKMS